MEHWDIASLELLIVPEGFELTECTLELDVHLPELEPPYHTGILLLCQLMVLESLDDL